MIENKQLWWDDELEAIIGLTWVDFGRVNTKEYKGGKWKEAMHEILIKMYGYYLGDRIDMFIQHRDKTFVYEKTKKTTASASSVSSLPSSSSAEMAASESNETVFRGVNREFSSINIKIQQCSTKQVPIGPWVVADTCDICLYTLAHDTRTCCIS